VVTITRIFSVFCFMEAAASRADEDVPRMSAILRNQIPGEQIVGLGTVTAVQDLDPQEVLD